MMQMTRKDEADEPLSEFDRAAKMGGMTERSNTEALPAAELDELSAIIAECREEIEDNGYPAVRRWLEANPGGKVLGHFQGDFPGEIAHAAGVLPGTIL